eukprot:gene8357-3437_t
MRLLFGRASPCSHATHVTVRNLRVPLPSPPLARGTRWHQTRASRNEGPSSTNDLASNGASKTAQVATNGKAADTSVEQQQPDMANELETLKQTVAALQQQLALTNSKLENTTGQLTLALGRRAAPGNISYVSHALADDKRAMGSAAQSYDPCQTRRGKNQATAAGLQIRAMMEEHLQGAALQATLQTCELITRAFEESESVQLREQDFGNFQDAEKTTTGESVAVAYPEPACPPPGADVYARPLDYDALHPAPLPTPLVADYPSSRRSWLTT